jgi:hypothetical protein
MACICGHAHHKGETSPRTTSAAGVQRWSIEVAFGERSTVVDLRSLVPIRVSGEDVVPLEDLWTAARLGPKADGLTFDFIAEDGFRFVEKAGAGVDGRDLSGAYLRLATRQLLWPPSSERPCFWRVKGVVRIVAAPLVAP